MLSIASTKQRDPGVDGFSLVCTRCQRELRIDLAELRLLTSKNRYIGTLCVKCFGALPVVFNLEPQVTGHSKDVTI